MRRKHKTLNHDCLCDAEWIDPDSGEEYEHCGALHEGKRWCMVSNDSGQSTTCRKALKKTGANWGFCDPNTDWSSKPSGIKRRYEGSSSSSSTKTTYYRASRCKSARQTDGISCGLYTILNAIQFAHNGSFLSAHVHPEMDTVANANVPLATFLRRFYTRVLVGQVRPGQRPLIVDVERVGRKNRIENYKLVVGFVASDTQMALVHGPFDYRAAVEGFTTEDRLKYSNYTGDLSKLYDSENMLTDDHIDGILQTMVRRKDILVVPTNISEHPERATRKGVPFFQNFLDKSGNEAQKHVLVPINHSCHWYLLHYDVKKNAFARANSIEDTKNVGKERVIASFLRKFYHDAPREEKETPKKAKTSTREDIIVLEEERFANNLKRRILLEEDRRGMRLVGARRAFNDRLRTLKQH